MIQMHLCGAAVALPGNALFLEPRLGPRSLTCSASIEVTTSPHSPGRRTLGPKGTSASDVLPSHRCRGSDRDLCQRFNKPAFASAQDHFGTLIHWHFGYCASSVLLQARRCTVNVSKSKHRPMYEPATAAPIRLHTCFPKRVTLILHRVLEPPLHGAR